jgi:hypothetical protein
LSYNTYIYGNVTRKLPAEFLNKQKYFPPQNGEDDSKTSPVWGIDTSGGGKNIRKV